jgi:hypothetical protein
MLLLAFAPRVQADALRCGDRLVHTDAAVGEVLAICGEPAHRQQQYVQRGDILYDTEELWTYDFGPDRLLQTLQFRNGRLVAIETGGYGYDAPAARSVAAD